MHQDSIVTRIAVCPKNRRARNRVGASLSSEEWVGVGLFDEISQTHADASIKLHLGKELLAIEGQSQRAALSAPHQKSTGFAKPLPIAPENPGDVASRMLDSPMGRAEMPTYMRHRRAEGQQALQFVACLPSEKVVALPCRDKSVQSRRQAVNKRFRFWGIRRDGCIHDAGLMPAIRVSSVNANGRLYSRCRTASRRRWMKSVPRPPA